MGKKRDKRKRKQERRMAAVAKGKVKIKPIDLNVVAEKGLSKEYLREIIKKERLGDPEFLKWLSSAGLEIGHVHYAGLQWGLLMFRKDHHQKVAKLPTYQEGRPNSSASASTSGVLEKKIKQNVELPDPPEVSNPYSEVELTLK